MKERFHFFKFIKYEKGSEGVRTSPVPCAWGGEGEDDIVCKQEGFIQRECYQGGSIMRGMHGGLNNKPLNNIQVSQILIIPLSPHLHTLHVNLIVFPLMMHYIH